MSAARNLNDYHSTVGVAARSRRLEVVRQGSAVSQARRIASSPGGIAVFILLIVVVLQGVVYTGQAAAVYEKSRLQHEQEYLNTTVGILAQEVDSLGSMQNLSDAAQALGMISNANPVFLSVEQQKVFGKPKAALNTDSGRVSKNLIANSAMVSKTKLSGSNGVLAKSAPAKTNVNQAQEANRQVGFAEGGIPASPTH